MKELKELAIALVRIALGIIILVEGLIGLVFLSYISFIDGSYDSLIIAAYEDSYDYSYAQTYDVGYQEAYDPAYNKGHDKGYEIGLETSLKEGIATRVELTNPTYKELMEFLADDETDSKPYVLNEYVSFDFAVELNNNAEANGIRAAYVAVFSQEWGHGMVAFETTDEGLIFIESQSDREVRLVVGEPYPWRLVGAISPVIRFNPIVRIQIIW